MMDGTCKVTVEPGVCKMKTTIVAKMDDDMNVAFEIHSDCKSVMKFAEKLQPVSPYSEVGNHFFDSEIYKNANGTIAHLACPVPCAVVKALEVAGGLGLKKNVTITIE
jgi:hypothetical protein